MKASLKTSLWRGMSAVMASLLVFSIGANTICNLNISTINSQLGTASYYLETVGEETTDSYRFDSKFSSLEELIAAQEELAVQIAGEGTVLLKNENKALPIDKAGETVTIWGLNSTAPVVGGNIGSTVTVVNEQYVRGIEEALLEGGFSVNQNMIDLYDSADMDPYRMSSFFFGNMVMGHSLSAVFWPSYEETLTYNVGEAPASVYTDDALSSADGTAAIVMISRDGSEAADYNPKMESAVETDHFSGSVLALSDNEKAMIELAKAHSSKVIVLLNTSNPMEIEELKQDPEIDSIVWVGMPGMYGFQGVAKVLCGEETPSGHLSDTYATSTTSAPSMVNWGLHLFTNASVSENPALTADDKGDWYLVESEGIYTGYKYYETRYEDQILGRSNADSASGATNGTAWSYADEMTYPFGYGLSYTTFEQKLENVSVDIGGTGTATVKVTNTGDVAGKSVVQLYVQSPYTVGGLEKSAIQLLDFGKTKVLQPGESETVTIEFDPQYMASYDEDAQKANGTAGAWVLEAGDYYFSIGNGAHEALNNVLANKLGTTDGLVTITGDEVVNAENAIKWTLDSTDMETYSINVENALQDADLNHFIENAVEYTTRADWTKGWTPVSDLTATDEMLVGLKQQTYSFSENGEGLTWGADNGMKLSDFIESDENGNFVGVLDINDPSWDRLVEQMTLEEATELVDDANIHLVASIGKPIVATQDGPIGFVYDQVGGYFVKWTEDEADAPTYVAESDAHASDSMTCMPTEPVVAATFNKELVVEEGEMLAETALWSNVNAIMAPGLNLHRAPYLGRSHEYYSEDPMLTNLMGNALSAGAKAAGLMAQSKHFAFNHQELNRSGLATFFNEQAGRETELRAFQGAMQSNNSTTVMTAFNRIGTVYSGAHSGMLTQIGRNEWGYTGWYLSDAINGENYMNWRDTIFGGGYAVMGYGKYEQIEMGAPYSAENLARIEKDTQFQQQLHSGLKYMLYSIAGSNAMNGVSSNTRIVHVLTWWQKTLIGLMAGFGVLTVACTAVYVVSLRKKSSTNV